MTTAAERFNEALRTSPFLASVATMMPPVDGAARPELQMERMVAIMEAIRTCLIAKHVQVVKDAAVSNAAAEYFRAKINY